MASGGVHLRANLEVWSIVGFTHVPEQPHDIEQRAVLDRAAGKFGESKTVTVGKPRAQLGFVGVQSAEVTFGNVALKAAVPNLDPVC